MKKGASKFWKDGEPQLALEIWSVLKSDRCPAGKVGWTLNEASEADMILYTFDPTDTKTFYLIPFQHLRIAFIHNYREWRNRYDCKNQTSGDWTSQAMFVPASVVINAVSREMTRTVA